MYSFQLWQRSETRSGTHQANAYSLHCPETELLGEWSLSGLRLCVCFVFLELGFEAATAAVGIEREKLKGCTHSASSASDRIAALWLQNRFWPPPQPHPTNQLYLCSDKVQLTSAEALFCNFCSCLMLGSCMFSPACTWQSLACAVLCPAFTEIN